MTDTGGLTRAWAKAADAADERGQDDGSEDDRRSAPSDS